MARKKAAMIAPRLKEGECDDLYLYTVLGQWLHYLTPSARVMVVM